MKRLFDFIISLIMIILLSPLLLVVAVAVACTMGMPVIFNQARPGLHGKLFTLYKFRTMKTSGASDADRLTPIGSLLRATSIDELPELVNVLKGEMSLVGPRPLLPEYLALYSPEQARRHEVRPGITGWAQVNGRNALSWEEKFRLDVEYVNNNSLWLDFKILLMTIQKVIKRDGISHEGEATMRPFTGSSSVGE